MSKRPPLFLRLATTLLVSSMSTAYAAAPVEVNLVGPRVRVIDVIPNAAPGSADVDLGPVPAPSTSRIIPRGAIIAALRDAGFATPKRLPDAVRVVRKMTQLSAAEIEQTLRDALPDTKMPRGATLAAVRAQHGASVPQGWTSATVAIPRPPRRSGPFAVSATLSFLRGEEILARIIVPIELTLSAEAATFDVPRGAPVMLVIKRGLVEVTIAASAAADADVGGTLPIVLRPSGRVVSARLTDKNHAIAIEGT